MLTCKITLPDSPHPVIIGKNPGFRALYLTQQNEVRFFRLINTKNVFFSFLPAGFCPKNVVFARVWGLHPPAPWLIRLCTKDTKCLILGSISTHPKGSFHKSFTTGCN